MKSSSAVSLTRIVVLAALIAGCESMGFTPTAAAEPPAAADGPAVCEDKDFSVYFDEWQADLNDDARDAIALVQRELAGCAIQHVRIVGLAGARGDETDNLNISMARAEAIAGALESGGWPAEHFELVAMGEADATVDGVASPMRRRAHIIVRAVPPATS